MDIFTAAKNGDTALIDRFIRDGGNIDRADRNGMTPLLADEKPWMNRNYSLALNLPPLAGIVLKYEGEEPH